MHNRGEMQAKNFEVAKERGNFRASFAKDDGCGDSKEMYKTNKLVGDVNGSGGGRRVRREAYPTPTGASIGKFALNRSKG